MCEVFNGQLLDGRDRPIISSLEYFRKYLIKRTVNVLQTIAKSDGPLIPTATKLFQAIKNEATEKWELTGMPCKHAMASIWNMAAYRVDVGVLETWVHPCYRLDTWKEVYSHHINPIKGKLMWPKSNIPTIILPPNHHLQVRRLQKKRKRPTGEDIPMVRSNKQSRRSQTITNVLCHSKGHNISTCKD
ncbi:hypothetical protein Tco_0131345 [Tanacetum coccineum]